MVGSRAIRTAIARYVTLHNRRVRRQEECQKSIPLNMFELFKRFVLPTVHAEDEELVCAQQTLRDKCNEGSHAKDLFAKYQACNDRVRSRKRTDEKCDEELFDYLHVLDECVAKDLFSKLK